MPKQRNQRRIDQPYSPISSGVITVGAGVSLPTSVLAGDGITVSGNEVSVDSTVVRTTRDLVAGAGLTGGGVLSADRTFAVGAGDGITVNADDVAVDTTVVRTSRALTAGNGLSGGGNLSADRSFAVGAGDGISVLASTVAVDATDLVSGDYGLEVVSNDFRVDLATNSGLSFATGLALGTPSTLSATSTNLVNADSHFHAVSASSNPGAAAQLLESTSGGALTLEQMTVNQSLYAGNTAFRVIHHTHDYDHAHVVINPGGSWNLDEQFGLDIDDNLLVRGWIVGKHAIQLPGATLIAHYDGMEPYELNYTGNPTGHMGQVGTVAGGLTYMAGKFGKAIQVAEATTNLVTNSSMEVASSGWSATNASGGITASNSPYGVSAFGFTASAQNGSYYRDFSGLTSGGTYTVSVYVRATSAAVGFRVFSLPGAAQLAEVFHTGNGGWQRLSATVTLTGGETSMRIRVVDTRASAWNTVAFDAIQVEEKAYMTPYCDGGLGAGHSFSGATHASTSSRTAATIWYPSAGVINSSGTVMFWLYRGWTPGEGPTNTCYFQTGNGTTGIAQVSIADDSNGDLLFAKIGAAAGSVTANTSGWAGGTWHHIALTWSSTGDAALYIDGALADSDTLTAVDLTAFNRIYIGSRAFGDRQCNGLIDDLVIADRVVDADEIRAIYESNAPVFAESSTWQWRAGQNRLWSDVEGLWMFNASGSAVLGAYAGDGEGGTKTWGGKTLGESDVLIGDEGRGGYLHWDDSAASLLVSGQIEVLAGSSGIATFSDAGSLATADDLDDVGDGTTYAKLRKTIIGGGYIVVGSGTKDSTLDGWIIDSGEIVGQENGVDQVVLSATKGTIRAGDTILRAAGIDLKADTAPLGTASRVINWWPDVDAPSGNPVGSIYNWLDGTVFNRHNTVVAAHGNATDTAGAAWLSATGNAGGTGYFFVSADGGTFYLDTNADFFLSPSSPTLGSNWSNHSGRNLSARTFANVVEIIGAIDAGASPSTTLATLATAYRPTSAREMYINRVSGGSSSSRLVTVNTNGTIVATDWTPLAGDVVYFQIMYFL